MALSERFSNIRLAVECNEDEIEPGDIEMLNKLIGNRFKYSCPALYLDVGRSDSVHSDNDDDNNKLEMDIDWKADFEASLKKSRENQNKATIHKTSCLKISPVSKSVLDVKKYKLEKQASLHETDKQKQITKPTELTEAVKRKAEITEVDNQSKNKNTDSKPNIKTQDSTSKRNNETSNKQSNSNQSKAKKDIKKPKVYNIEPAVSFPLDDLLPSNNQKPNKSKSQTIKNRDPNGEKISPAVSIISPQIGSSVSTESPQIWSSTCSQTSSISGSTNDNTFYGTVYTDNDNFEAHDNFEAPDNFEAHNDYNDVMLQCIGGVADQNMETGEPMWTSDSENSSMVPKNTTQSFINSVSGFNNAPAQNYDNKDFSNNASEATSNNCLLEAMQYGNMIAIEKIKAALNAKLVQTRQVEKEPELCADGDDGGFGFYKERNDNQVEKSPENKSEELFDLLVQQIYALAETEEDKGKVESYLKVFKDEWRAKLLSSLCENSSEEQVPNNLTEESDAQTHDENEKHDNTQVDSKGDRELFEGRTLLKGGVNPRHIPKTNINKKEKGRARDPRNPVHKSIHVKLLLPGFHEEFQKEMKSKERKIPYNAKDPRCFRMVSEENNKIVVPAPVKDESDIKSKTDNAKKESSRSKLNDNAETNKQNTIEESKSGVDFGVVNNASSSYIGKSWDLEQQNVIQVIINQSPSLNVKERDTKTVYRPSVLQNVNIVDESDVDLTNVNMDISNEGKKEVVEISDDSETEHVKADKLKLDKVKKDTKDTERNVRMNTKNSDRNVKTVSKATERNIKMDRKSSEMNVKTESKGTERNVKTDTKVSERKNVFSRLGAKKTETATNREIEDLRNMLNRGIEQENNSHQETESKDKDVEEYGKRLERESQSRSRDTDNSNDLEGNERMFKRCERSSSVSSSDSRDSDRCSSRVKYKEHRNKYRTTSSNKESKFTDSNRLVTREHGINTSHNEPNAIVSKLVKTGKFPSQHRESNIININFAKNSRDSGHYNSHTQNAREASIDRSRTQNPREASQDRFRIQNPRESSIDRSRNQNPRESSLDRSHSRNPKEASQDGFCIQNPRETSTDRFSTQNPREGIVDRSGSQNPRDASKDISRSRNPRETDKQRPFGEHKALNQDEYIDNLLERFQPPTKDESKSYRDPIWDGSIGQGKFVHSVRPVPERSHQEPLSDRGSVTLERNSSKNDPQNKIRPLSSIKDRLTAWKEQKFDLRSTLSSKTSRKRQHDLNTNIEEVEEKKTKNQTVICNVPDLRDKIKGNGNVDKADKTEKDKTVSDDVVQEEVKVKFTKSGSCGAAESGNSSGLFSALGKHALPRQPCNQRTAKALKQAEDDRKFLEEYKKKILSSSGKSSPNQSSSSSSSVNMSSSSSSDVSKMSTGRLSYSDMLGLAEKK